MMHINIAICDDETAVCGSLELYLSKLLKKRSVSFEIDVFYNGEELCQQMASYDYNLLFLDIGLPGRNGIEIGHFIREHLKNEQIQIIYISSTTAYAMSLFEFHPLHFLVKPLTEENIQFVIDKYLLITNQNSPVFVYQKKRQFIQIPIPDILYFENIQRKVKIVTLREEDEFYGSLKDISKHLKGNGFLFIHSSFLVNCRHIKRHEYEQITLTHQIVLPVSQSYRKLLKDLHCEHILE